MALSSREPQIKVQDQPMNHLLSQSLIQIIHIRARAHRWPMLALFRCASTPLFDAAYVCRSVCLSVTLSLNHQKPPYFCQILCSFLERASNKGSGSINQSFTQSLNHKNARAHRRPILALFLRFSTGTNCLPYTSANDERTMMNERCWNIV